MTTVRHPVLNSRIPATGRKLTRAECTAIRSLGILVPHTSWIMQAHASDYIGALYRPVNGGMLDVGVSVTLRDR
jgi:hypothetical protein